MWGLRRDPDSSSTAWSPHGSGRARGRGPGQGLSVQLSEGRDVEVYLLGWGEGAVAELVSQSTLIQEPRWDREQAFGGR